MNTKFDHYDDAMIDEAWSQIRLDCKFGPLEYETLDSEDEIGRIAWLAMSMRYWNSWVGHPVTYFQASGTDFDGHHRVRAVKYLATRHGLQLTIPVRYDPRMNRQSS